MFSHLVRVAVVLLSVVMLVLGMSLQGRTWPASGGNELGRVELGLELGLANFSPVRDIPGVRSSSSETTLSGACSSQGFEPIHEEEGSASHTPSREYIYIRQRRQLWCYSNSADPLLAALAV